MLNCKKKKMLKFKRLKFLNKKNWCIKFWKLKWFEYWIKSETQFRKLEKIFKDKATKNYGQEHTNANFITQQKSK